MISVDGLSAGYDGRQILHAVSLDIALGKVTALLGPNGCGKSTLLRAIARLLPPDAGQVHVGGEDIYRLPAKAAAQRLALLPQHQVVPEGVTVRTLVGYGRSPYVKLWGSLSREDWAAVDAAMEETGVTELADRLVSELSGGQQQRVFLAMTLAQDTPILLLDEPTTYLDWNHQEALMNIMRRRQEKGVTVVAVLHDLNQAARYCDELAVLKAGRLMAQGAPDAVMTAELLTDVFSVNAGIHRCAESGAVMALLK